MKPKPFFHVHINGVYCRKAFGVLREREGRNHVLAVVVLPNMSREDFPIGRSFKMIGTFQDGAVMSDIVSEVLHNGAITKGCFVEVLLERKTKYFGGHDVQFS